MSSVLILERCSPRPEEEICRVLIDRLGLHATEAVDKVRTGGGSLAESDSATLLEATAAALHDIGVETRIVDRAQLHGAPRACKIHSLELLESEIRAAVIGGSRLHLERSRILGIGVHGLPSEAKNDADDDDSRWGRKKRKKRARPAKDLLPAGVTGTAISPRGRTLLANLAAADLSGIEFYLTLYCARPFRPIRIHRNSFQFGCMGEQRQSHSLDNFLLLLEDLLDYLPGAWNREHAERFLSSLEPRTVACARQEQMTNFDRWMMYWVGFELDEAVDAKRLAAIPVADDTAGGAADDPIDEDPAGEGAQRP